MQVATRNPFLLTLPLIAMPFATAADQPSAAPIRPVTDEYHGRKVVDPYRYMENLSDPDVQAWIKAQADHTSSLLSAMPGRAKLLARVHELNTAASARVGNLTALPGMLLFYEKTLASENVSKLYVRRGLRGEERILVDPTKLNKPNGPPHVINYYNPSWNGEHVVVGISEGGSEQAVIHIFETATGKESAETIDRAPFGIIAWKDESSFLYHRLQKMMPGMPPTEKQLKSTIWLHKIGSDVEGDVAIFGYDRSPLVTMQPMDIPVIGTTPDSRHGGRRSGSWSQERIHVVCGSPCVIEGGRRHPVEEGDRCRRRSYRHHIARR